MPCLKNCIICNFIGIRNCCTSTVIEQKLALPIDNINQWNCKTENVVYLITCRKCGLQYVGETKRKLCDRFREHRNSVLKNGKQRIYEHFNSPNHLVTDMEIEILQQFKSTQNKERLDAEAFWIKQFNTLFPFGLNTNLKSIGTIQNLNDITKIKIDRIPYFTSLRLKRQRKINYNKKHKSKIHNSTIHNNKKDLLLRNYINQKMNPNFFNYKRLKQTNKNVLKQILYDSKVEYNKEEKARIMAYLLSYERNTQNKTKRKLNVLNSEKVVLSHSNKIVSELGISKLLQLNNIGKIISKRINTKKDIQIIYKHTTPNWVKVCNYSKFVNSLNDNSIKEILSNPCHCDTKFRIQPFDHVITGDLSIVRDENLRTYLNLGTKYKENSVNTPNQLTTDLIQDISIFLLKLEHRLLITCQERKVITNHLTKVIRKRIIQKITNYHIDQPSNFAKLRKSLKSLQKHYIITPTDKVPGNFSLTCKKLYTSIITKECGIELNSNQTRIYKGNEFYKPTTMNTHQALIILQDLNKQYNLKENGNNKLPHIFATPKLHKNPIAFRCIVAAKNTIIKPLDLLCSTILKHYQNHFKNYCNSIYRQVNKKVYISVTDSVTVALELKENNGPNSEIYTGDFTALFPSLEHTTIIENIGKVIDLCHKNAKSDYIDTSKRQIRYTTNPETKSYHKNDIKTMCKDLLLNSYMSLADTVYAPKKGTPQGFSVSCVMSDLVLSYCEYKWLKNHPLPKNSHLFRYVDDLMATNIPNFKEVGIQIYPKELILNNTTISQTEANFLDLTVNIEPNNVIIKIYNKTDSYKFQIHRYFISSSNVPTSMPTGVLRCQILRFIRLTNNENDLFKRTKELALEYYINGFTWASTIKNIQQCLQDNNIMLCNSIGIISTKNIHRKLKKLGNS